MANVDLPRGLQIYGPLLRSTLYTLASGYATSLYKGDPVVALSTGDVGIATAGSTGTILGSALAFYDLNMVPMNYWLGATAGVGYVLVADSPEQLFVAQGDGDTSYLDAADKNGNVAMVSAAGSAVNYLSGWELDDSATAGGGATEQIRLIRPVDSLDNTVAAANCAWICRVNNHQALQGVVGTGV